MASLARLTAIIRHAKTTTRGRHTTATPLLQTQILTAIQFPQFNHESNPHCLSIPHTNNGCHATINTTKRCFATKNNHKNKNKPVSGSSGRVAVYQSGGIKTKRAGKVPRMCSGCGCQIVSSGNSEGMAAGSEAVDDRLKQAKLARYMDVTELAGKTLCERCKALQGDNIWKAYDALRDVSPQVFVDQLRFVVSRRRFAMGVLVVDATDSEHSVVPRIRDAVNKTPLVLVWNKIDLLPRFDPLDQHILTRMVSRHVRPIHTVAVSAKTGRGVVDLAHYLLENLGGRDVFVLGSANVGKSTLVKALSERIARAVRMKGKNKQQYERRREQASTLLNVTGSNLPGTTLQAVRIPCFSSNRHALWDTPGIINSRALQYRIFPSHLMEPLTRPGRIEVPSHDNHRVGRLSPGYTLLIESTWMSQEIDEEHEEHKEEYDSLPGKRQQPTPKSEECVLARIDLLDIEKGRSNNSYYSVFVQAYLHPSLRVRVVPTSEAPDHATIPTAHIQRIQQKIKRATGRSGTGLKDEYSIPLEPNRDPNAGRGPNGEVSPGPKERSTSGKYYMDVVFPSLGWIFFCNATRFAVVPHCVAGSVYSKRKSLYPIKLYPTEELAYLEEKADENETQHRLKEAAREGRHLSNATRKQRSGGGTHWEDDLDLEDWH